MDEGWWSRTVRYGDQIFAARCPNCSRFVKTDASAKISGASAGVVEPNAECARCGRVETPFLEWAWEE